MGRAKMIYTLEESAGWLDVLEGFVLDEMEIARLFFASSEREAYRRLFDQVRQLGRKREVPFSILMDIKETNETKEKVQEDILFGIKEKVDYVTVSCIYSGKEVKNVRKLLDKNGGANIGLIVKIEEEQENYELDAILKMADGIMLENKPCVLQKEMMKKAYDAGKMMITTTQLLDFRRA